MRLLETPLAWIAIAVVLLAVAILLLLLARRRRPAQARSAPPVPPEPSAAPDASRAPSQRWGDQPTEPHGDGHPRGSAEIDPPTDPVAVPTTAPATPPAPAAAPTAAPTDGSGPAKDRLLAALLGDPDAAVAAVRGLDRGGDHGGPSGTSVASLLRAGLTPAQVASLCGTREADLAQIVARDLGLLDSGRNDTPEPGRAWASAGSAAGSTTPTTG